MQRMTVLALFQGLLSSSKFLVKYNILFSITCRDETDDCSDQNAKDTKLKSSVFKCSVPLESKGDKVTQIFYEFNNLLNTEKYILMSQSSNRRNK